LDLFFGQRRTTARWLCLQVNIDLLVKRSGALNHDVGVRLGLITLSSPSRDKRSPASRTRQADDR
jgi:hypothetical protein